MEQVLLQNSENIKSLIHMMKLHEENILRHLNSETDTDVVMKDKPIPDKMKHAYAEYEYASLPQWSIRPRSYMKPTDPMIVIQKCGHTFRKDHFTEWIKTHHTCMSCDTPLL